jgi:hypothetical protein
MEGVFGFLKVFWRKLPAFLGIVFLLILKIAPIIAPLIPCDISFVPAPSGWRTARWRFF